MKIALPSAMLALILGGFGIFTQAGCGGGATAAVAVNNQYLGTQSPGDVWSWDIDRDAGTFTAVNETLGHHYAGTAATLASGFTKLVVSSTDDTNVSVGAVMYGVESAGNCFVARPAADPSASPVVATALGHAITSAVHCNWVEVPQPGWTTSDPAFGYVDVTPQGTVAHASIHNYLLDGTFHSDDSQDFDFDSTGKMTWQNGTGAITPSGAFFIDWGPNAGGVIGLPTPSADVDWNDVVTRSFRGVLVHAGRTDMIQAVNDGNGNLRGRSYVEPDGVETNTLEDIANAPTLVVKSQPSPGCFLIDLHHQNDQPESLVLMTQKINGKYMIFGFGYGQQTTPYAVIAIEQ